MSQTTMRIGAAIVAFVVVAVIGIAGLFSFAPDEATGSWSLVGVLSLAAALAVYAAIEYAQTGRLESISRQFDTRTIVLIPIAIALNIVLGQAVAAALKIPVYLDSIGTILVGVLAGPIPGALTGLLANLLWTYVIPPPFQSAYAAPFAVVAAVIGLLAGVFGAMGWMRPRLQRPPQELMLAAAVSVGLILVLVGFTIAGYQYVGGDWALQPASDDLIFVVLGWIVIAVVVAAIVGLLALLFVRRDVTAAYVVVAGLATGIVAALISAPISANVFGGVTGAGTDFLVTAFRTAGADIQQATLGQGLISDPIDKVITFFVVYVIVGAMAVRTKARFPQGERLIPIGDPTRSAADPWDTTR
ncbi:MAG: hypothetical protein KF809_01475 [Chloroflexi bacterium]|nr:hypothetical protein [Chloroflexota bacterium]